MTPRPADVGPTWGEAACQLVGGLASFSALSHPHQLAAMAAHCLPRHGMTPAAAIVGAALAWGDAVALTDQWGSCSYHELAIATGRLAAVLSGRGWVKPGTRVGVMAHDDRWLLAAFGAVGLCGGTIWPLNPKLGTDDLTVRLRDDGVELVIHAPGCETALAGFTGRTILTASLPEFLRDAGPGLTVPQLARSSGFVMLTGGTTSTPSAVPIKRRWSAPLTALALASAARVRHGQPTLLCAPLFHGYGLAVAMLCLIAGSPLILSQALPGVGTAQLDKGTSSRADWGVAMLDAIQAHHVHSVFAVPAQLRSLARRLDAGGLASKTAVRAIASGADRLDDATIRILIRNFGPVVTNYYGTTESGTLTLISGRALEAQPDALGRPVAGVRLRIVDESGRVLRRGEIGLIQASSPMGSFGDGWRGTFTTSDLGWIDDAGHLHLQGRASTVQRLGGEFVDLARVEAVLTDYPGVVSARAWLTPDDAMGQRVAAAVTTAGPVSVEAMRAHVRARLGPAAVPVSIDAG